MIVTVTLNPALHVSYEAERVSRGAANPVSRVSYRAGGRGLAVAKVLHTFGHEVVAAGLVGGASGDVIRAELARAGVATQFTRITGESRRVLEITDAADGTVTSFGEPAPYITTEELGRLAADYRALMADATAAVLCGSLPAGLPAETYGSLASYAAEAGVPVVLDASGSALRHAVSRRPALVIPGNETGEGPATGPATRRRPPCPIPERPRPTARRRCWPMAPRRCWPAAPGPWRSCPTRESARSPPRGSGGPNWRASTHSGRRGTPWSPASFPASLSPGPGRTRWPTRWRSRRHPIRPETSTLRHMNDCCLK